MKRRNKSVGGRKRRNKSVGGRLEEVTTNGLARAESVWTMALTATRTSLAANASTTRCRNLLDRAAALAATTAHLPTPTTVVVTALNRARN